MPSHSKAEQELRDRLLKQRGLATNTAKKRFYPVNIPNTGRRKTPLMKMLELKYGKGRTIEEILLGGSLSDVAKQLGSEVDNTTLSKWIKRFKLRFTKDNLPECQGCMHYKPDNCDYGVCPFLIMKEEWELVQIKRKELLDA